MTSYLRHLVKQALCPTLVENPGTTSSDEFADMENLKAQLLEKAQVETDSCPTEAVEEMVESAHNPAEELNAEMTKIALMKALEC